jgi:hypothetical protein
MVFGQWNIQKEVTNAVRVYHVWSSPSLLSAFLSTVDLITLSSKQINTHPSPGPLASSTNSSTGQKPCTACAQASVVDGREASSLGKSGEAGRQHFNIHCIFSFFHWLSLFANIIFFHLSIVEK